MAVTRLSKNETVWAGYLTSIAGVALVTVVIQTVHPLRDIENVTMFYLLAVILIAIRAGSGPAFLSAILSYLAIDWFVAAPQSILTASNPAQWVALISFTFTAFVTGRLTASLRDREQLAIRREQERDALARASWSVAAQIHNEKALSEVLQALLQTSGAQAAAVFTLRDSDVPVRVAWAGDPSALAAGLSLEDWKRLHGHPHLGENLDLSASQLLRAASGFRRQSSELLLPLRIETRLVGTLQLRWELATPLTDSEKQLMESLVSLAAVVLERGRLQEMETEARALREGDRLKTALLAMLSHDLRNPLSSIKMGITSLLRPGGPWDPLEQRELLEGMSLEVDWLIRMVNNVLSLSRLEADAWQPEREIVDVSEVVGAALDSFSSDDNQRIRLHFTATSVVGWLDEVQMVQVLHNLLENALKYSPTDSLVDLDVHSTGDELIITVRDRGRGLNEDEMHGLFEPFRRGREFRESSLPGIGVGLPLCRGLVEAHSGQITAANHPEGGAEFRVALPLQIGPAQQGEGARIP